MATKVYTFKVTYEGVDGKIWRMLDVSSNYRADQLGYLILAAFETKAYHLFDFDYYDGKLSLPHDSFDSFCEMDISSHKLYQLYRDPEAPMHFLTMHYDFGIEQIFNIELVAIYDMPPRSGHKYPRVTDGAGRGIIDDLPCDELLKLIKQIDKKGKTNKPIYYWDDDEKPWDYRDFDADKINKDLKRNIAAISDGYYEFWAQYGIPHGGMHSYVLELEKKREELKHTPDAISANEKTDIYTGVLLSLFSFDDLFGLTIDVKDEDVCLRVDTSKGIEAENLKKLLLAWKAMVSDVKNGKVSEELYEQWKNVFPFITAEYLPEDKPERHIKLNIQ